ncbi:hypothetical protein [Anabaena sp. CCY 0017]|uniref:hypothetical protein n=1 Tax=Anabaena sp. CCY 0017 TaxID=3103866 RepID=UPI0039C5FD9E
MRKSYILQKSLFVLINICKWLCLSLNNLQPKPKTIWFNAWKHDKAEALWAAFALEFLRQISIGSNIILFWLRYDWKNGFSFILVALLGLGTFVRYLDVAVKRAGNLLQ